MAPRQTRLVSPVLSPGSMAGDVRRVPRGAAGSRTWIPAPRCPVQSHSRLGFALLFRRPNCSAHKGWKRGAAVFPRAESSWAGWQSWGQGKIKDACARRDGPGPLGLLVTVFAKRRGRPGEGGALVWTGQRPAPVPQALLEALLQERGRHGKHKPVGWDPPAPWREGEGTGTGVTCSGHQFASERILELSSFSWGF